METGRAQVAVVLVVAGGEDAMGQIWACVSDSAGLRGVGPCEGLSVSAGVLCLRGAECVRVNRLG